MTVQIVFVSNLGEHFDKSDLNHAGGVLQIAIPALVASIASADARVLSELVTALPRASLVTAITDMTDGQKRAIATCLFAALPTDPPAASGEAWNDRGAISIS